MSNTKTIAKNTIFLYIRMLVLMLVSLYTTRVLLMALGIDDYGIFNVVGGLIVMITFIKEGLTGAGRRYIMAELATGDVKSQQLMYTNVVISHLILCGIILLFGETIGLWFFSNYLNIPDGRFNAAMWVYQLSLASSLVMIMLSPFNAVIVSEEKMSAYAYFSIIDAVLKLVIVWVVMAVNTDKLIVYAFLVVGVNIVDYLMYYVYCRRKFEMCRIVGINGTTQLKELFGYMGWTVFGLGANVTSRQGVTMLVNIYFNVAVNAAIGISNMIISAAQQFVSNFQMAFAPQLTKNYIARNYDEVNSLVSRASRYSSFLVLVMLIPISVVISELLEIWLGEYPQYTEEFCIMTLICIYFDAMSNPLTTVITADKNIKVYQVFIASVYLIDFLISWCVLVMGALPYYVIVVRGLLSIVGMLVRLKMIKQKVIGFSVRRWLKAIIGRGIIIVALSLPLLLLNHINIFDSNIWLRFIVMGTISLIWVGSVIWLMGLTKNERKFMKNKFILVVKRKKCEQ